MPLEGQRLAADEERRLALGVDALAQRVVVVLDVGGLVRGADAGHRHDLRAMVGRGDDRRAPEGVSDEQAYLAARGVHVLDRAGRVGDLVGERSVAPVPVGLTEAEVVEAEHADALARELFTDPARGRGVLAKREAVGEDPPSAYLALRDVDEARQGGPGGAGEFHALGHRVILSARGERFSFGELLEHKQLFAHHHQIDQRKHLAQQPRTAKQHPHVQPGAASVGVHGIGVARRGQA